MCSLINFLTANNSSFCIIFKLILKLNNMALQVYSRKRFYLLFNLCYRFGSRILFINIWWDGNYVYYSMHLNKYWWGTCGAAVSMLLRLYIKYFIIPLFESSQVFVLNITTKIDKVIQRCIRMRKIRMWEMVNFRVGFP